MDGPPERALIVFLQGMIDLERSGVTSAVEAAQIWTEGLRAFRPVAQTQPVRSIVTSVRGPD